MSAARLLHDHTTVPLSPLLPTLFTGHGAPTYALAPGESGAALQRFAGQLPGVRAVLVVTAHWDTPTPAVGGALHPETIHDYWGFPEPLYDISYPAPGAPNLAQRIRGLIAEAGLPAHIDPAQGLDHGVWIPARVMFPHAEVPVLPLSIQSHESPEYHLRLGAALAPLLGEGVLIVASGNLTHNLHHFAAARRTGRIPAYVPAFQAWMWGVLATNDTAALLDYRRQAPEATAAHPTDDHLLPLYVALGAAGANARAERVYSGISDAVLAMDSFAFWPQPAH